MNAAASQGSAPRKLILVEECLIGPSGHFFQWNKSVKRLNEARGYAVKVYAHGELKDDLAEELGAVKHFKHSWWFRQGPAKTPLHGLYRFFHYTWHNWRENAAIVRREGQADCIMISTVRIHQLIAWYFICRKHLGKDFQRLFFFVITGQGTYEKGDPNPKFGKSAGLFRFFLKKYAKWVKEGKVCFANDSDQTSREYEILAGVPFHEIPSPAVPVNVRQSAAPQNGDPVRFITLGPVRHEKGSDVFHDAILKYLERYPDDSVRFAFHWPNQMRDGADQPMEPDPKFHEDARVELITDFLSSEAYEELFLNAHCVVLPYRWTSYFARQSNQVAEAGTAGLPMIVTDDTWLSRAVDRWAHGLKVPDGDTEALVTALKQMHDNIAAHLEAATQRRPNAQAFNSPERFMAYLWGEPVDAAP
ncbi:MAG: glycosyltransferase [Opitutales bacterium]